MISVRGPDDRLPPFELDMLCLISTNNSCVINPGFHLWGAAILLQLVSIHPLRQRQHLPRLEFCRAEFIGAL